jgi:hypothetical protein
VTRVRSTSENDRRLIMCRPRRQADDSRVQTLSQLVQPAAVDLPTLRRRYGTLLELVRKLIGVVPHCDPVLEIWPTAFRSYNVMVPNLLDLPFFLWGVGAPKPPVALAMYAASRTADCMYCSAHCCSFALRRGASAAKIATQGASAHTDAERAAIDVAVALASVPARLTVAERARLLRHLPRAHAESVVLAVAMMGFLNKFMDAMGIDLEASTVDEVSPLIGSTGFSPGRHRIVPTDDPAAPAHGDSLAFKLAVIPLLPSALALDRRWTAGVPARWPDVGAFLRASTGHDFPVLKHLVHPRAIRAIATMVRDNCAREGSLLGLDVKHRAGLLFATVLQNETLATEMRALAAHTGSSDLDGARSLGAEALDFEDGAAVDRVAREHGPELLLAKAAAYSPARVTPRVVERASEMAPGAVVELIAWLSVLQMLHRLHSFFDATEARS